MKIIKSHTNKDRMILQIGEPVICYKDFYGYNGDCVFKKNKIYYINKINIIHKDLFDYTFKGINPSIYIHDYCMFEFFNNKKILRKEKLKQLKLNES